MWVMLTHSLYHLLMIHLASSISHPGSETSQIVETLKKAGVADLEDGKSTPNASAEKHQVSGASSPASAKKKATISTSTPPKKSVSFVDGAKQPSKDSQTSTPRQKPTNDPSLNPSRHGAPA